jgi:PPE-repeat protein
MTYPCLPPEVNSARMQAGAGSGPMLAASSAWSGLAGELRAAANILGLNTPAIAATESHYDEMWAQDVTAMSKYHAGASSAWAGLAPLAPLQENLPKPVAT